MALLKYNVLFVALLLIYTNSVFAANKLPEGLTYESSLVSQNTTDFLSWDKKFEKLGYEKLQVEGSFYPVLKVDWLDRLYQNKKTGAIVMIKANLKLSKKVYEGTLYNNGDDFFVHLSAKKNEMHHVVFFTGLDSKEVSRITAQIEALDTADYKTHSGIFSVVTNLFLQKAYAGDGKSEGCSQPLVQPPYTSEDASYLKASWECLKGAVGGVWDATGGGVIDLVKGAGKMIFRPVETFNSAKEEVKKMAGIMGNMNQAIASVVDGFDSLPLDVKAKVSCQMATMVGTGFFVNMFTGGAATPYFIRLVSEAVFTVATTLKDGKALIGISAKLEKIASKIEYPPALSKFNEAAKKLEEIKRSLASEQRYLRHLRKELETAHPGMNGRYGAHAENHRYGLVAEARDVHKRIESLEAQLPEVEKLVKDLGPAALTYRGVQAAGKAVTGAVIACKTSQQLSKNVADYNAFIGQSVDAKPSATTESNKTKADR